MTTALEGLLVGVVLGFSLAVPPGPMNAWIAAVAARSFRAGVVTGFGAMTADAVLGAVVYILDRTVDLHAVVRAVYLLGAGVMAYLGARLLRRTPQDGTDLPDRRTYVRAIVIGLSNPFQVLWWLTAGIAFAYLGGLLLLLGLFGAIVVWIVALPWAVHTGTRRHPSVERWVRFASAAILVAFAIYFVALFVA